MNHLAFSVQVIASVLALALIWICCWTGHHQAQVLTNTCPSAITRILHCEIASIVAFMLLWLELRHALASEFIAHAFHMACCWDPAIHIGTFGSPSADTCRTLVIFRLLIFVITGGASWLQCVFTAAICMLAHTFHVAIAWWRSTHLVFTKVGTSANTCIAYIVCGQRIVIVARCATRLWDRSAVACEKIAGAWSIAFSSHGIDGTGLACAKVHARTSPSEAYIIHRFRIAIVTTRFISHLGIGAQTSGHVAGARCMALIER
jgi:hypothetical protein